MTLKPVIELIFRCKGKIFVNAKLSNNFEIMTVENVS